MSRDDAMRAVVEAARRTVRQKFQHLEAKPNHSPKECHIHQLALALKQLDSRGGTP